MSIFGPVLDYINDKTTDLYHAATGAPTGQQKREQMNQAREQMESYRKLTEVSEKAIASAKQEKDVAKRAIQEKQIRALRRSYRPAGFLDQSSGGLPTTVGG